MTRPKKNEREDQEYHIPTYDRPDFKIFATEVVLPAIRKVPAATKRIRERIGSRLGDERKYSLIVAIEYLLFTEKIFSIQKHVTMYTSAKPKEKPKAAINDRRSWNHGVIPPRGKTEPHYQAMFPEGLH